MARDTATVAARNRRIRQDSERERLSNQGHVQHVIEIIEELNDETKEFDHQMIDRKKFVVNTKLALIKKYLPDEKVIEIEGGLNPIQHTHKVEFVGVSAGEED